MALFPASRRQQPLHFVDEVAQFHNFDNLLRIMVAPEPIQDSSLPNLQLKTKADKDIWDLISRVTLRVFQSMGLIMMWRWIRKPLTERGHQVNRTNGEMVITGPSETEDFGNIKNIFNRSRKNDFRMDIHNQGAPASMPARLSFVDVETTGLSRDDRVVSIGVICLETPELSNGRLNASITHRIFDPGKKCHPKAELVHGFDDWTLRHQDSFSEHADSIRALISEGSLIVAHNAAFDMSFINKELDIAKRPTLSLLPVFCTMRALKDLGIQGSVSLSSICGRLGISRQGKVHGALEDAWIAMQLYLLLHRCPAFETPFSQVQNSQLMNYREPPPRPVGPLPRRRTGKSKYPLQSRGV
jgi:DNA polymerase-3 subunit epsilon